MSVSTIGACEDIDDEALAKTVKSELSEWFGAGETDTWSLIKTYRIPFAQPPQVLPPTIQTDGPSSPIPQTVHEKPLLTYLAEGNSHGLRMLIAGHRMFRFPDFTFRLCLGVPVTLFSRHMM